MGIEIQTPPEVHTQRPPNYIESHGHVHPNAQTEINAKLLKMAETELGVTELSRAPIPEGYTDLTIPNPAYIATEIDLPRGRTSFRKEGDNPDPDNAHEIKSFQSYETLVVNRDSHGRPLNPVGPTGLSGRGMLDKWGPTQAADPIVTRTNPGTGRTEILLIARGDTGEWALPGGKVDDGETAFAAAGRELVEEGGVSGVKLDFEKARLVYRGYVDDTRNTDNAWMETTALHLELDDAEARAIQIQAGSDAADVRWVEADDENLGKLFATHGDLVRNALNPDENKSLDPNDGSDTIEAAEGDIERTSTVAGGLIELARNAADAELQARFPDVYRGPEMQLLVDRAAKVYPQLRSSVVPDGNGGRFEFGIRAHPNDDREHTSIHIGGVDVHHIDVNGISTQVGSLQSLFDHGPHHSREIGLASATGIKSDTGEIGPITQEADPASWSAVVGSIELAVSEIERQQSAVTGA